MTSTRRLQLLCSAAAAVASAAGTIRTADGDRGGGAMLLSWSLGFTDGVVLQRSHPVVYGQVVSVAAAVTVTLLAPDGSAAARVSAEIFPGGADGKNASFRADLPPQRKGWGFSLVATTVSSSSSLSVAAGGPAPSLPSSSIALRNVSFGEVVLCSGQSNVSDGRGSHRVPVECDIMREDHCAATPPPPAGADVAADEVHAHPPRVLRGAG
jgi:hypothetical protein